jgi:fatty-acid peroxygenase
LLDVYGLHHDPEIFPSAHAFYPERFLHTHPDPFTLIPQGGGDRETGHRCPGEALVMTSVALALHVLVRCVSYRVPEQDLSIDLRRMPTAPKSGMLLAELRTLAALEGAWPHRPTLFAAAAAEAYSRCPVAHGTVAR